MFDPLAFLKPDKAFSMEGLLSRDLFEKFASDDGANLRRRAHGDILDESFTASRNDLVNYVLGKAGTLVEQINQLGEVVIVIHAHGLFSVTQIEGGQERILDFFLDHGSAMNQTQGKLLASELDKDFLEYISNIAVHISQTDYTDEGNWFLSVTLSLQKTEDRLHKISSLMDDNPEQIAKWLNDGFLVAIAMVPTAYEIILIDDNETQIKPYRVDIDDGPPLTHDELIGLAQIMEEKIDVWFNEEVAHQTEFVPNNEQINMFLISKLWILKHSTFTTEIDPTNT